MTDDEPTTVIIHVTVKIMSRGDWNTDLTVDQWNDLTDQQRSDLAHRAWEDIAQPDNGGVWVTTTGAKDLA